MKERNTKIDIIKGIAIILMVWGHSGISFGHEYLYLFHMAVFLMASGFFYKEQKDKPFWKPVVGKIKSLWVPYVLANVGFTLFTYLVFLIAPNTVSDFESIYLQGGLFKRIITEVLMLNTGPFAGATWFIKNLFGVWFVFFAVDRIYFRIQKAIGREKAAIILGRVLTHGIIAVVLLVTGWIGSIYLPWEPIYYNIERMMVSYIIFFMGWLIGSRIAVFQGRKVWVLSAVSAVVLFLLMQYGEIDLVRVQITNPCYFVLCSLLGWFLLYGLSDLVDRFLKYIKRFLSYTGQKSMYILIWHVFAMWIVGLTIGKVMNNIVISIANLLAGCLIPIALAYIIERCKNRGDAFRR